MKNVEEIKDVILKFVISIMDKEMNKFELNYEENLFDLGMDSIKYVKEIVVGYSAYATMLFRQECLFTANTYALGAYVKCIVE